MMAIPNLEDVWDDAWSKGWLAGWNDLRRLAARACAEFPSAAESLEDTWILNIREEAFVKDRKEAGTIVACFYHRLNYADLKESTNIGTGPHCHPGGPTGPAGDCCETDAEGYPIGPKGACCPYTGPTSEEHWHRILKEEAEALAKSKASGLRGLPGPAGDTVEIAETGPTGATDPEQWAEQTKQRGGG